MKATAGLGPTIARLAGGDKHFKATGFSKHLSDDQNFTPNVPDRYCSLVPSPNWPE